MVEAFYAVPVCVDAPCAASTWVQRVVRNWSTGAVMK